MRNLDSPKSAIFFCPNSNLNSFDFITFDDVVTVKV